MLGVICTAQQSKPMQPLPPPQPASLVSPEVHADGSVTFRFRAPNAVDVKLALEGVIQRRCKKMTAAFGP